MPSSQKTNVINVHLCLVLLNFLQELERWSKAQVGDGRTAFAPLSRTAKRVPRSIPVDSGTIR